MTERTLINNIIIVNEGQIMLADILIDNGVIEKIGLLADFTDSKIIDGTGKYLFPGIIDGQVHFREPGLTHKGDFNSESRAAAAIRGIKQAVVTIKILGSTLFLKCMGLPRPLHEPVIECMLPVCQFFRQD